MRLEVKRRVDMTIKNEINVIMVLGTISIICCVFSSYSSKRTIDYLNSELAITYAVCMSPENEHLIAKEKYLQKVRK